MSLWRDFLGDPRLNGVLLPVVSRQFSGGRDLARKQPPYTAGVLHEDTGRQPARFQLRVSLQAGIRDDDGQHYPERYEELVTLLQNDAESGREMQWDDPVLGASFPVRLLTWSIDEVAERQDGAVVQISLEETGLLESSDAIFSVLSTSDQQTLRSDAAEFDALIAELAVDPADVEEAWAAAGFPRAGNEPATAGSAVGGFLAELDEGFNQVDQAVRSVERVQGRVQAMMRLPQALQPRGWEVQERGFRMLAAASPTANAIVVGADITFRELEVPATASIWAIAKELPVTAEQLLADNVIPDPITVRAGTVLQVRA